MSDIQKEAKVNKLHKNFSGMKKGETMFIAPPGLLPAIFSRYQRENKA